MDKSLVMPMHLTPKTTISHASAFCSA